MKTHSIHPSLKAANVVLLGGGTGGHIFPLVAVKKALEKRGISQFYWIGEKNSLEETIARREKITFCPIRSGKFRRYFSIQTLIEPINVLFGFFQAFRILRNIRPVLVFSKGGYVSVPGALAAKMLGIPVYLHESDAIPGLANRWVGRFSRTVFLGFSEAASYFTMARTITVGQLLNPDIAWEELKKSRIAWTIHSKKRKTVFVICGSLGSSRIFEAVLSIVEKLPDFDFEIALGTHNSKYREKFAIFPNVSCHDFLSQSEMAAAYARADLAITRAGATTLGELEAAGCPMVIIPLEGSANDHQKANARAYLKKWAQILLERDLHELAWNVQSLRKTETPSPSIGKAPESGVTRIVEVLLKDFPS